MSRGIVLAILCLPVIGQAATKLGDLVLADDLQPVTQKIEVLEQWAVGDNLALQVEEAATTNATFKILYTNDLMYASANEHTNTLNAAKAYTREQVATLAQSIDAQKADKAWGKYMSGGASAEGSDTLIVEKKALAITGGANFSKIESTGYYVLSVSLGSSWNIESLAAEQNPDNPTTFSVKDGEGNVAWQVTSTSSREVACVPGVDMYAPSCSVVNGNDVVTMLFPVDANEHPVMEYIPSLDYYTEDDFAEATAANWPSYISSVVWSQPSAHLWKAVVTMIGQPGQGFFRGKYTQPGTVYTNFANPLGFARLVINGTNYPVHVETINGKKLLVLE